MKKLLTIGLCICMVLVTSVVLAACGDKGDEIPQNTIAAEYIGEYNLVSYDLELVAGDFSSKGGEGYFQTIKDTLFAQEVGDISSTIELTHNAFLMELHHNYADIARAGTYAKVVGDTIKSIAGNTTLDEQNMKFIDGKIVGIVQTYDESQRGWFGVDGLVFNIVGTFEKV